MDNFDANLKEVNDLIDNDIRFAKEQKHLCRVCRLGHDDGDGECVDLDFCKCDYCNGV